MSSNSTSNGFTPVRRKESTLSGGRLHRENESEWTAARCNRLLRRLTSRVTNLQRERSLNLARSQSSKRTLESDVDAEEVTRKRVSNESNWMGARKRLKRTYSGRSGKSAFGIDFGQKGRNVGLSSDRSISSLPGEIIVPTPLLNRALNHSLSPYRARPWKSRRDGDPILTYDSDQSSRAQPNTRFSKAQSFGPQVLRDIRKTTTAVCYNNYEGIYDNFKNLLDATQPTVQNTHRRGPRSLLSACLRAIPEYIKVEEGILIEETKKAGSHSAIGKRDVSMEIYDDLEQFGSSGHGWYQLRSVVRAHGVSIACSAICENLFDSQFSEKLTELCINSGHHEEAESLVTSILSNRVFTFPKKVDSRFADDDSLHPMSMFWQFVDKTQHVGFQYRTLSSLIDSNRLPLPWLATQEFEGVWTGVIQALSIDHTRADSMKFLNVVLPRLVEYASLDGPVFDCAKSVDNDVHVACRHTLLSVLTTISSIVILGERNRIPLFDEIPQHLLPFNQIYSTVLADCLSTVEIAAEGNDRRQYLILLLTILVTGPNEIMRFDLDVKLVDQHLRRLWEQHESEPVAGPCPYNEVVNFVSSVARCCGRGASTSGFEYLEQIHGRLRLWIVSQESNERAIWYEILVDSAFTFAQHAPGQKYLDYAASIDKELKARNVCRPTSSGVGGSVSSPSAFRWEEGISAWVTTTPAQPTRKMEATFAEHHAHVVETPSPSTTIRTQRDIRAGHIEISSNGKNCLTHVSHDSRLSESGVTQRSRNSRMTNTKFGIWCSDSSDDELNSSFGSSQGSSVLRDVRNTNTAQHQRRQSSRHSQAKRQSDTKPANQKHWLFSDDELGI